MALILEQLIEEMPLQSGSYTSAEAARLLGIPNQNIRRWLLGYSYSKKSKKYYVDPLWQPQIPIIENNLELGFRDLIELRFVHAFTKAGVGLLAIRNCLEHARECVNNHHPFSTQKFKTDGRTIFLESIEEEPKLIDLKNKQYVFKDVIEKSFKDLDLENGIVARWRPFGGKKSIVIDPERAFGQPITDEYGVPTRALAEAVEAEGSISSVARLYEISLSTARDAVAYEESLDSAA